MVSANRGQEDPGAYCTRRDTVKVEAQRPSVKYKSGYGSLCTLLSIGPDSSRAEIRLPSRLIGWCWIRVGSVLAAQRPEREE